MTEKEIPVCGECVHWVEDSYHSVGKDMGKCFGVGKVRYIRKTTHSCPMFETKKTSVFLPKKVYTETKIS